MDLSILPSEQYIPGRQEAIDHAGSIEKEAFVISTSILFAAAVLSSLIRFTIRIIGRRKIQWDDGFVLLATMTLSAGFIVLHKYLNSLYLTEAINKRVVVPFREDIPRILDVVKWSYIFAVMAYTSIYLVKASFLYFFYPLTPGLSKRVMRIYWGAVVFAIFSWACTVVSTAVICPHFGANAVKCSANPRQHARSLGGNITVACLDIICDVLIVAIPILVLKSSLMPFSQKVSIAVILCLSTAMIVCALVRLIGSITSTRQNFNGTAPVWSIYWAMVEACVSLIMTSAIVIRGIFRKNLNQNDQQKQESTLQQLGRRLLSILKLSGSSKSSWRSPQRSGDQEANHPHHDQNAPRIATQNLPQGTLSSLKKFIRGGKKSENHDNAIESVDSAYTLQDLDYHDVLRNKR